MNPLDVCRYQSFDRLGWLYNDWAAGITTKQEKMINQVMNWRRLVDSLISIQFKRTFFAHLWHGVADCHWYVSGTWLVQWSTMVHPSSHFFWIGWNRLNHHGPPLSSPYQRWSQRWLCRRCAAKWKGSRAQMLYPIVPRLGFWRCDAWTSLGNLR